MKKGNAFVIIVIAFALVVLPMTVELIGRSTETRRRAAGGGQCSPTLGCLNENKELDCSCQPIAAEMPSQYKDINVNCGRCSLNPLALPPIPVVTITKLEETVSEINNSGMMIDIMGVGDSKFPIIPFQSKEQDYYKVIKCQNFDCSKRVIDNLSHIEPNTYTVPASGAQCQCNYENSKGKANDFYCYYNNTQPMKSGTPCVACAKCKNSARCQAGGVRDLRNHMGYCPELNQNITFGAYCSNPEAFSICSWGEEIDNCICCATTGINSSLNEADTCSKSTWVGVTPAYEKTENMAQGLTWYRTTVMKGNNGFPMIAFNYIPLPTMTPRPTFTITPTPTITPTLAPVRPFSRDPISVISYKQFSSQKTVPAFTPNTDIGTSKTEIDKFYREYPFSEIKLSNLSSLWMAMDTNKLPLITFYDDADGTLKLIKCETEYCELASDRYVVPIIGPGTFEGTAGLKYGKHHAMVIDGQNHPLIAYSAEDKDGNSELWFIKCSNVDCSDREGKGDKAIRLDGGGTQTPHITGQYVSMYLDSSDNVPVISYYDEYFGRLMFTRCKYTSCAGNVWTTNTIDGGTKENNVGKFSSIASGCNRKPMIAYYDNSLSALKYAYCKDLECSSVVTIKVDGGRQFDPDTGKYPNLRMGGDGLPVMSYFKGQLNNNTVGNIMLAKCGNCECMVVPTNTPTPTSTPTPTNTPTQTPTSTPRPTNTPTQTPTLTPRPTNTSTPTPTEVPKNWQKTCKSLNVVNVVNTPTPTPTQTPTNTPTVTPTPPIIHPECTFRCEQIKTNYTGPNKWGGDYNCDGILSGGDFSVWRNEAIDKEFVGTRVESDGTCDGRSTVADYARWREELLKQI